MPLTSGSRIGVFQLVELIGRGGMGEVYRATDTKLKRQVAIKILPSLAADPERMARFQREAEVLASLNHPNIAIIHGLEDADGAKALVMELVEGDDLSQRIARGAIPLDEALPIAKQIADALEAAHEQGIIHRDLKPANIKVRSDGTVKVLDFGLSKAMEPAAGSSPTMSMSPTITTPAMTQAGMILGTAAYMSPEQARGKTVDKRADIWAFGAVLFEMLTGKRAFPGEDLTDTLAAVVKLDPKWDALAAGVPARVRQVLRACLQKDPKQRMGDVQSVRLALEGAFETVLSQPAGSARSSKLGLSATLGLAVALLAAIAFAIPAIRHLRETPAAVFRSQVVTTGAEALAVSPTDVDLTMTPDGSHLVYRGANQLLVRAFDQLEAKVLVGRGNPRAPFSSPDGQWIGFFDSAGLLRKVAISGGPPVTITKLDGSGPRGATWGGDDTVVYAATDQATGLLRVSAAGGEATVLTRPRREAGEADHQWPEFLPGNQALLFTIVSASGRLDDSQVAVLNLSTGKYEVIIRGGYNAHYLSTGYLVYGSGGALRAVRFDVKDLKVVGTPVPVLDQVMTAPNGAVNAAFAMGNLAYVPVASRAPAHSLVWVTRDGHEEMVPAPARNYDSMQLSPDGSRVALQIADEDLDLWIWDFGRRTLTRLTFGPENDYDPAWTPDGRRIVFTRGEGGSAALIARAADGTGAEERLTTGFKAAMTATSFSLDGTRLLIGQQGDIWMLPMATKKELIPIIHSENVESRAYISPDGRWVAYQSNEAGQDQIVVQPFPELSGGRWQVSPRGGADPAWAHNGRELFYIDGAGALVSVPIETGTAFSAGNPTKLFDAPYPAVSGTRRYDVTPDGTRFLFVKAASDTSAASASLGLVVVQHFDEELKRLVPTK